MESVTTRWYIAPEGLFSSTNYDKAGKLFKQY